MPSAQRTIVIDRPVDEVFAFFTDPSNDLIWRPQVKEVSAAGRIGVGSRIHQVVKGPGGRGIAADIEVTDYQQAERYTFRVVAGPVRPTGEFRFTADGDATTVSFSLAADLSGLKKALMSRPVQKSMDGEMRALNQAKAALEAS